MMFAVAARPALTDPAAERLDLSPQEWREDLAYFARQLPRRHGNAYHFTSRDSFETRVAQLDRQLDRLNSDEVYVGLDRLANMIGDGHTYVKFPSDTPDFPLRFKQFGSEYRVVAAALDLRRVLGARLVEISDTPVARVHELILPLTPQDENPPLREANLSGYLSNGVVLHGLGISASRDTVRYGLVDSSGTEFTLNVQALSRVGAQPAWVWAYRETPLYRQNADKPFWSTWLPDSRTVYCSFRRYTDLGQHARELFRLLDTDRPEKLVVDLRQNTGGDYTLGDRKLIRPLRARADLNRPGHLFVLVGPQTFSAAMNNAAQFRAKTAALLVGETVGEKPSSWQEPREMTLPRSHLTVRYSTKFYEFARGGENILRPDQEIAPTWEDYRAGRDPVLDWVLAYESDRSRTAPAGR